jgi:hypothetical protein
LGDTTQTTREPDIDARSVRLDRLSHDEAMQLIEELALKYLRLQRATPKEYEDLYLITQGNPLFIRWIAGQLLYIEKLMSQFLAENSRKNR